ncbi:MAG TPA: aldo/keto reductase [Gaiellaceae bacterium]|nr:aldo/keto reductase [Gaiellaceae bacterium]
MRFRRFEPLGRDLSVLVLGTALFEKATYDESTALLDAWVERGGNAIDTGRQYGNAEAIVGRWLRERDLGDEVVVITKGGHYDEVTLRPRVTAFDLAEDLAESKRQLGRDTIDLLLVHRDDPTRSVQAILDDVTASIDGAVRVVGASNWSTARLEEAADYAERAHVRGFACSSPNLSLAPANEPPWPGCVSIHRGADDDWYTATQLPVFAWQALAGGFFAGIHDDDVERVYGGDRNHERLARARQLAERHDATPSQVALAWVLARPYPVHAIVGPRSVEELDECTAALQLELSPEELAWLDLRTTS